MKFQNLIDDQLAMFRLTRNDLTPQELNDMIDEAKTLDSNPDMAIFGGYFDIPGKLSAIEARKLSSLMK